MASRSSSGPSRAPARTATARACTSAIQTARSSSSSRTADLAEALRTAEELGLRTRGRRTGRSHAVRLWFAHEDGVLWLRADERAPDWLMNLRRHPECAVRIGGHDLRARYEPVADREVTLRKLVDLWRAKYGAEWVQPWYVEKGREPVLLRLLT